MTKSIKLFLIVTSLLASACSGSVQKSTNTAVQAKVQTLAAEDTAAMDSVQGTSTEASATATATMPLAAPQAAPVAVQQQIQPQPPPQQQFEQRTSRQIARPAGVMFTNGMIPGQMGTGYVTQPVQVYGGPTNQMVNFGVAAFDTSTSNCQGGCAKIYISADTMPPIVERSNGVALIVDGFAVPMSYFGQRTPMVMGDLLLADGSTTSRPIYIVPLKKWNESIRWHLPDAGEHAAKLCFYYKGAGNYHHLLDCTSWTMSVNRSSYPIQYGIWGK